VPSTQTLLQSVSLSDIVRTTAVLTASGFLTVGASAANDANRPEPAPRAAAQDAPPAAQSGDPVDPPAVDPVAPPSGDPVDAPRATDPAPAPAPAGPRDAAPEQQDRRTIATFDPRPPTETPPSQLQGMRKGRRTLDDSLVKISLKGESIENILPIIYEWTGKHVFYNATGLGNVRLNIVGDREVPKSQALDFLFQALKMNNFAVTETEDMIFIGQLTEFARTQPGVVLGPSDDVMSMPDNGLFVTKVFRLSNSRATDILERIQALLPEDYVKWDADGGSNQIILSGDIGLAKKVQTLINMLDVPSWNDSVTRTIRLQYQDASTIASLINEIFADDGSGRSSAARTQQRTQRGQPVPQPGQPAGGGGPGAGPIVSVLQSMNSITIRATPAQLMEIERLISGAWDLPPNAQGSIFRTYDLKYADPAKVRDLLGVLLGSSSGGGGSGITNRAAAGGRILTPQGGGGGESSPTAAVANIFSIEAYPDSNRLVVISKTPDNFEWLDRWIDDLDQPFTSGLPKNVPLKHASAVELSEILNTLLAQSGTEAGLRLPEEGLTGLSQSIGGEETAGTGGTGGTGGGGAANQLRFPWQGGRAGATGAGGTPTEVSGLIGRSRIVPNASQNSVLVMAPPEVEKKVIEIIEDLDKPGRQVMITAVLAEVKVGDGFSWGARIGRVGDFSSPLNGTENSVTGNIGLELEKSGTGDSDNNFANPWFNSSTLTISTTDDLAFFLQALSTDNSVRILQQPRVFTSDNKEAKFEAGSDVSFLQGETSGAAGTTTDFDQQFVGVGINVRPRITQENNVAMEVKILLSNLSTTTINSNPVVDRRETNTTVTVKNGQTIVISGIRREQETQIDRRIPFLGDIPILGAAFSSTERSKEVVELVVFLVPLVVENPDANDGNFNLEERERLRMLQEPLDKGSQELLKESKFFEEIKSGKAAQDAASGAGTGAGAGTGTGTGASDASAE
jgi:general secretion pathway protein D